MDRRIIGGVRNIFLSLHIDNRSFWDLFRALKIGGAEVAREKWDEADVDMDAEDPMLVSPDRPATRNILPDWTRTPLPLGAPPAVRPLLPIATEPPPAQIAVGA